MDASNAPSQDLVSGDYLTLLHTFNTAIDHQATTRGKPRPTEWTLFDEVAMSQGRLPEDSFAKQIADSVFEAGLTALDDHRSGKSRFITVSAPTGSGKSSYGYAMVAAILNAYPDATVLWACETLRQAEAAYWELLAILQSVCRPTDSVAPSRPSNKSPIYIDGSDATKTHPDLAIYTGWHNASKSEENRAKVANFEPTLCKDTGEVISQRFTLAQLKAARVAIVTHQKLIHQPEEIVFTDQDGLSRPRTVTFVDEQLNGMEPFDITIDDVWAVRRWARKGGYGTDEGSADDALGYLARYLTAAWDAVKVNGRNFEAMASTESFSVTWFYSQQAQTILDTHYPDSVKRHEVITYARCLMEGRAFMARDKKADTGGLFIAYETALKPAPGTICLDATSDVSGIFTLRPDRHPIKPPEASFDNLYIEHLTIPKGTLPPGSVAKIASMARTAEPYAQWIRDTVLSKTAVGEKALVVMHKGLIGHHLLPDPKPGQVYADLEGRQVAWLNWGAGIGRNDWRFADVVFLMGEFYVPKWSTLGTALGVTGWDPKEYLPKVDANNTREPNYVALRHGHLARWEKQLAVRGNARNLDRQGVCGKQRLYVTAEFKRFEGWRDRLFPAAQFALDQSTVKAQQEAQQERQQQRERKAAETPTVAKDIAACLRAKAAGGVEELSSKDLCEAVGIFPNNLKRSMAEDKPGHVLKAMNDDAWQYIQGKGRTPSRFLRGLTLEAHNKA